MNKLAILKEIWEFLRERKKWWLIPLVLMMLLLGLLMVIAHGAGPLAPFIYSLF